MESAMNATLDKSLCVDFVDFGKHQDRFGRFSWTKNQENYLKIHFKVFEKETLPTSLGNINVFRWGNTTLSSS